MRMKGKKPIFNYGDTYSLDVVLSPIICAGIARFREVILEQHEKGFGGVPGELVKELGIDSDDEKAFESAFDHWISILDQMIYAFGENEPSITDYDFSFDMKPVGEEDELRYTIDVVNQEEHDRYEAELADHNKKVQEGLDLFAQYYHSLWW